MGSGVSIFLQSIDASSCRPRSVSEKYIWRLSAVPSSRLTNSFSSTERSTFDMFEGVSPSRSLNSPQESLPAFERLHRGHAFVQADSVQPLQIRFELVYGPLQVAYSTQSVHTPAFCERPACRSA